MRPKFTRWIVSLGLVSAASVAYATVSVDEIVRLHSAGLSEQSLLLVVSASDTPDTLSTAQLTQMIEAQVPDTVISELVSKADAVMEDWQPVNLDQEINGLPIYTETEVYQVYPGWGGYWGWPNYGWCATPYYDGWYDPWYSGFYVGFGNGGWGFGFGWGGGYCGYYDPWYWGGGYCGYWDPYPGYGYGGYPYYPYYPYYGYDTYRVIDRPNYHNGAERGTQRGVSPTPYRQDPKSGTDSRTQLASLDSRTQSTLNRSVKSPGQKQVRNDINQSATQRTTGDLRKITTTPTQKSTLVQADRGEGRFVIKGEDKKLRATDESSTRNLETLGSKFERSTKLESGSKTSDRTVQGKVVRGIESGTTERKESTGSRVADATRSVSHKATSSARAETTGDKVNRYVQMKSAQKTSGTSKGSRTTSKNARLGGAEPKVYAPSGSRDESAPATSGRAVQKQGSSGSKKASTSSTGRSAPRQISRSGGAQRSAPSAGGAGRVSGGSMSGGSRGGGGGGARGGGGGSRGGSRGGR